MADRRQADRFPDYDVLARRGTPSWNDKTRQVVDERLALEVPAGVLTDAQSAVLRRLAERICPDPAGRPATTTVAMVVHKITADLGDGYRHHALPGTAECWRRGLDAIDAEARARFGSAFADCGDEDADRVLRAIEAGEVVVDGWDALPPRIFWRWRLIADLVSAHWAQPSAWSAMGFGGPASPRGYVRLNVNRRDPWEAIEGDGRPLKGLPRHHA